MRIVRPFRQVQNIKRKDLNDDLMDYVWVTNYFTAEEVVKIRALWDNSQADVAKVNKHGEQQAVDGLRKSRVMFIEDQKENEWIYDKLAQACLQINSNRFKFDIVGFQTRLQLAKYSVEDFFEWHMDYGKGDVSNRKLSITVQLSDPEEYEGGDLQFMINHHAKSAPRTKGTAIVFPSYAMHRVLPITSGSRMSIVGWIAGQPYR